MHTSTPLFTFLDKEKSLVKKNESVFYGCVDVVSASVVLGVTL